MGNMHAIDELINSDIKGQRISMSLNILRFCNFWHGNNIIAFSWHLFLIFLVDIFPTCVMRPCFRMLLKRKLLYHIRLWKIERVWPTSSHALHTTSHSWIKTLTEAWTWQQIDMESSPSELIWPCKGYAHFLQHKRSRWHASAFPQRKGPGRDNAD